jgi:arylsulfatase A-like enzyme
MFRLLAVSLVVAVSGSLAVSRSESAESANRPNIIWIYVDDMSANFSCYGEKLIATPHVDRLAKEGTRFSHAFTTAPVCSPARSALITGMYQTSIDAHNHRSGRGTIKLHLPDGIETLPALFRKAGYYVCSGSTPDAQSGQGIGKTDYNFDTPDDLYDGNNWSGRKPGQPFFAQIQLGGGKLRGGTRASARKLSERAAKEFGAAVKPEDVVLPPYYPSDPVLLEDWAAYLDSVRFTDEAVGKVLARLEQEGLLETTVVSFMTDHGISHARGKQFLYDEGIHVPWVIRGPGIAVGVVRDDLVEHIDLAATSLALAGIEIPKTMQGRDVLAANYQPRDAVFAARDRCDETIENLRAVRTADFKYIRNGYPLRPHLQPNNYKDGKSIVERLRELHAAGTLPQLAEKLLFSPTRPPEELYDLKADPFETKNLAGEPQYAAALAELRSRLDAWQAATNDHGRKPESWDRYDSDMAAYVGKKDADNPVRKNIEQMKRWAAEGK